MTAAIAVLLVVWAAIEGGVGGVLQVLGVYLILLCVPRIRYRSLLRKGRKKA